MKKQVVLISLLFNGLFTMQGQISGGSPITSDIKPVSLPLAPEAYSLLKFDINPVDLHIIYPFPTRCFRSSAPPVFLGCPDFPEPKL